MRGKLFIPAFIPNNLPDAVIANMKSFCQRSKAMANRKEVSHFSDLFPIQRGSIMSFACCCWCHFISLGVSSLCYHIRSILKPCAHPKMVRSCAFWIIALMKNPQAIWYWAIVQHPRCPICADKRSANSHSYLPVTTRGFRAFPFPTSACFNDFFPKAFRESFRKTLRGEIFGSNFFLHNFSWLNLCRVPGCFIQRGDNSFIPLAMESAT